MPIAAWKNDIHEAMLVRPKSFIEWHL